MADPLLDLVQGGAAPQGNNGVDPLLALVQPSGVAPPAQQQQAAQSQDRGFLGQIGDAATAFGHHFMNLPHGGAQLIMNTAAGLAQKIAPDSGWANAIANTAMSDDAALAKREKDYQASVPDSDGAYIGAATGEIAPFLFGGGLADAVGKGGAAVEGAVADAASKYAPWLANRFPGLTSTAAKAPGRAAQGASISAFSPVNEGDFNEQKGKQVSLGALLGGAAPVVGNAISGAYNQVKGAVAPLLNPNEVVRNALVKGAKNSGTDPQALAAALRNAPQYVEGVTPTTAQAGATPFLVQAEKTLTNNPEFKTQFESIANQNNRARIDALNKVSGNPGDIENLTQQRQNVAGKMYQQAFEEGPAALTPWIKGQVTQLMKRPAMQQAAQEARTLAQNEGISLTDDTSIQGLHYAKMALDDQISRAVRAGDNNQVRVLSSTQDKLLTVMEKLSPIYQQARQTYAQMSQPINSMEAAAQVINKVSQGALNSAGEPQITLPAYRSALAKALSGAKYGIQPEAESALQAVQSDLQRQSVSSSLKSPGSDTAFNLQAPSWLGQQLYGEQFSGKTGAAKALGAALSAIGGAVTGGVGGAGAGGALGWSAMQKLSAAGTKKVNAALFEALTNPKLAADFLNPAVTQATNPQLTQRLAQLLRNAPQSVAYSTARQSTNSP